jgi:MFS family permease
VSGRSRIACAAFIGMLVTEYPVLYCSFPQLLQPVSMQFGWGRSVMPLALLIFSPVQTLLYPFVGLALDRWGSRRILVIGFALFGLSMTALSQLTGSVAQMVALYVVAAAWGTLVTGVSFGRVVARSFAANRGLMLGICLGVGGGLGAAMLPPITQVLLEHWGWRGAYVGLGLIPIIIGASAALCLPSELSPGRGEDGAYDGAKASVLAFFRLPVFWSLIGATLISCMVINGLGAHLAAIASDLGLSKRAAALLLSIFAFAMMAGQFGVGRFLDRYQSPKLALPVFSALLLGVIQIQFATTQVALTIGVILIGLGAGSEYGLLPYFISRFFGLRAFGFLYATLYAASAIGSGIGPYAMGAAFDIAGSYRNALIGFEIASLGTLALIAWLPAYAYAVDGSRGSDQTGYHKAKAGCS